MKHISKERILSIFFVAIALISLSFFFFPTQTPKTDVQSGQVEKATVKVTIDDQSFSLALDKGENHCDVLQKALADKQISQLLMKYDTSLDSYGVYQINNVGKKDAIWWVFTINGKSPPSACNHVLVNNGDRILWRYIGTNN